MAENDKVKEGITYLFFGVLATIVNYGVFWVCKAAGLTATDLGFLASNAIAWTVAVIFAYFTNRTWVFKSKAEGRREIVTEAAKFFSGRLFSGFWEIVLPSPLEKLFHKGLTFGFGEKEFFLDGQWIAKFCVTVLVVIMNYVISKFFVFKKNKGAQ